MEKLYKVFVSSTYIDLRDERREVTQALLESDCIPAGMELFHAADKDQWTLIKNVISILLLFQVDTVVFIQKQKLVIRKWNMNTHMKLEFLFLLFYIKILKHYRQKKLKKSKNHEKSLKSLKKEF